MRTITNHLDTGDSHLTGLTNIIVPINYIVCAHWP